MPIRERLRRAMRKSDPEMPLSTSSPPSSSSTNSNSLATTATYSTGTSTQSSQRPSSRLVRAFTWNAKGDNTSTRSNSGAASTNVTSAASTAPSSNSSGNGGSNSSNPFKRRRNKTKSTDPRERPLTAVNLQHQELLSNFSWTYGTRRTSQLARSSFGGSEFNGGVSPGHSRRCSLADGTTATVPRATITSGAGLASLKRVNSPPRDDVLVEHDEGIIRER